MRPADARTERADDLVGPEPRARCSTIPVDREDGRDRHERIRDDRRYEDILAELTR